MYIESMIRSILQWHLVVCLIIYLGLLKLIMLGGCWYVLCYVYVMCVYCKRLWLLEWEFICLIQTNTFSILLISISLIIIHNIGTIKAISKWDISNLNALQGNNTFLSNIRTKCHTSNTIRYYR